MSDSEDPIDPLDEGGDDLFGDEGDEEAASPKQRVLDDDELASDPEGDSYSRYRNYEDEQPQHETKDRVVMAVQTFRHRVPKPKDGALRVLRVPKFIKVLPEEYDPETFQPTEFDVVNAKSQNPKHVARVRRDHGTGELKSNTNVFRWSDGSVTISVGGEHYEISKKGLAPDADKPYNELHDGHYYAAAAELSSNLLMTVGHITEQYNVRPNKAVGDDALSVLAEKMAMASKTSSGGDMIIRTTRDPELQKKQAEMAEKERIKAQRRRENAVAKMDSGYGRTNRGGLSIGDLEGGSRGAGSSRKRGAPGSGKRKPRGPEYDTDDELPQGVRRQDEYDLEDDFLVNSDEEEEESDGEDEEELYEEDKRRRSKKRRTREPDEDEDAEGSDVEPMEASGRSRRRHVIDDDDD
ncbi:Leo1-like protein-domain-containing protein [Dactylonectria macrodidyma]|uniref:Leo1-like protein-domain-containing protein n=1 Tax=Dactylonectria macrodidyma TaxID=307937 RepID=A0A9P9JLJ2_9HYPO|nr:Leo1-like protein-domain-containing protein [Dactylonectria macrodidyma]